MARLSLSELERGMKRHRTRRVLADKGLSSVDNRACLAEAGIMLRVARRVRKAKFREDARFGKNLQAEIH